MSTHSEEDHTNGCTERCVLPKPAILVAPPADERDAWRLIVDAIATEIVPPAELVDALRPVLAKLARAAGDRIAANPGAGGSCDGVDSCYAIDLASAARQLERAEARRLWERTKALRQRRRMDRGVSFRTAVLVSMVHAVRLFRGA